MMPKVSVNSILEEIESLAEEDRLSLERQLAQRTESEWEIEAANARQSARVRRIDQDTIDQSIERRRYGDK